MHYVLLLGLTAVEKDWTDLKRTSQESLDI